MKKTDIIKAWGRILTGYCPSLSIEITRECPLRCPGCYAYEPEHLGETGPLRSLADYKNEELIAGVLALVRKHRPLHVSIVGGEPLVRFRELNVLLPKLSAMGIGVQLVTSAVRQIPPEWAAIENLHLAVSIDGLQPDHDLRRKPATYDKILENIKGQHVTVHCTITRQQIGKPNYYRDFLAFWTPKPEVKKVWFSIFTPQIGAEPEELLTPDERAQVLKELSILREEFPKLELPKAVIKGYEKPPQSPEECIFSRTTVNYTADLQTKITPCQFGGNPDCTQCGCFASAGLSAIGDHKLMGFLPVRSIFMASSAVGDVSRSLFQKQEETKAGQVIEASR